MSHSWRKSHYSDNFMFYICKNCKYIWVDFKHNYANYLPDNNVKINKKTCEETILESIL